MPYMRRLRILIVGAGIAGTAAASFLARRGHEVTVVERAGAARSSGSPVDIRGG
ncbi:MAG TPA: FAD-dependent oxidoreductase, partial [Microbacterium sp.]|nr:FAD-dependent oxidoreductase [Microbacterium sp.]